MSAADTEPFIHKLGNYLHQRVLKKKKKKLEVLFFVIHATLATEDVFIHAL